MIPTDKGQVVRLLQTPGSRDGGSETVDYMEQFEIEGAAGVWRLARIHGDIPEIERVV